MARKRIYTDEELSNLGNRIAKIRTELCDENNTMFAEKLGIAKQTASNLCGGSKGAGKRTIDKILDAFPEVNRKWLVLGEGPMLAGDHSAQTNVGDHSNNSGNITTVDDRLVRLLEEATAERMKLHAERERLLNIIESLTTK